MKATIRHIIALGVFLLSTGPTLAQSFLTNGLIAIYPFSGTANDASGNGRHLINSNATPASDRFGQQASAMQFNGSNSWLHVDNLPIPANNSFTWSVWISPAAIPDATRENAWILNRNNFNSDNAVSPSLTFFRTGSIQFSSYDPTLSPSQNTNNAGFSVARPPLNRWTCVTVTSATNNVRRIYINGLLDYTYTSSGYGWTGGGTLNVGTDRNPIGSSTLQWFSGLIDDVRVYNRTLSSQEVASLYYYESKKNVQFVKSYTLDFDGLAIGTNYQLQVSTNLTSWTNWGSSFTATNEKYTNVIPHQRVDDWSKLFFRLTPQ
jgi:hypothetical protein